ncbi:TniQ family protein [Dyella tabacisoli]|uniref:TniQ family protein n=1 Tax=Dyella tabacisoli TaxID=2282381 RepID=UPI001CDBF77A|nr:TniQ family protein [Dyella tabacisoli]
MNPVLALLPDETVSSWKLRNVYGVGRFVGTARLDRDADFGSLKLRGDEIFDAPLTQLREAAKMPDTWLLCPAAKQFCPLCWAEDWVSGSQPYSRRSWRVAWRTCCGKHGLFQPLRIGTSNKYRRFPLRCLEYPQWSTLDTLHLNPEGIGLPSILEKYGSNALSITDRRGIHIQNALEPHTSKRFWYPHGFDPTFLRSAYAVIVKALQKQFSKDQHRVPRESRSWHESPYRFKQDVWRDLGFFFRLDPSERFSINVLAEAILSTWTNSPLPIGVFAHRRTQTLVDAIGWAPGDFQPAKRLHISPLESLKQQVEFEQRTKKNWAEKEIARRCASVSRPSLTKKTR